MKTKTLWRIGGASLLLGGALALLPDHQGTQGVSPAQAPTLKPRRLPPPTTQRIYAPLPSGSWRDGEIVLSNNGPGAISVAPTFFIEGASAEGSSIELQPTEVRWVRLSELALDGRDVRKANAVELQYVGHMLEVGAQLTLLGAPRAGTADVPFSGPSDYRTSIQEAVWPIFSGAKAVIAIGNASDQTVFATVQEPGGRSAQLELGPHVTQTIVQPGAGDNASTSRRTVDGLRIDVRGPVGSVRAAGFVQTSSGRFAGAIRFYDPGKALQPNLVATNLRIASANPVMVLKNTSNLSVTATPTFFPLTEEVDNPMTLAPVTIPPYAVVEVKLDRCPRWLRRVRISRVSASRLRTPALPVVSSVA